MLPLLDEAYIKTGKLYMVYKEYPVIGGEAAAIASFAGQCAAQQEKFFALHDWLFANVNQWRVDAILDVIKQAARDVGLDGTAFDTCLDTQASRAEVVQDYQEGQQYGIRGTPNFVINGRLVQGALPYDQFAAIIDALAAEVETGVLPNTVVTVTPSPTPDTDFEPEAHAPLGDPNAPVTIVEFSDYQCPYCLRHFTETMPQIRSQYIDTGKVRYIFMDFTPTLRNPEYHPQAVQAAQTAECAGAQGRYWEMHDKLFAEQARWADNSAAADVLKTFATELALDADQFAACLDNGEFLDEIESDLLEGIAAGVTGTPGFFINGTFVSGAQPFEAFEQVIEAELRK